MANVCSVCRDPNVAGINAAILASLPVRDIAKQYGTTASSVHRHKDCIPKTLAKIEKRELKIAKSLDAEVAELLATVKRYVDVNPEDADPRTVLAAAQTLIKLFELRQSIEIEARKLNAETIDSPEFTTAVEAILAAVKPCCRGAVMEALKRCNEPKRDPFAYSARDVGVPTMASQAEPIEAEVIETSASEPTPDSVQE